MNLLRSSLLVGLLLYLSVSSCLGSAESCIAGIDGLLSNIKDLIQKQPAKIMELPIIAYSGKGLNNLGSYELCKSTPNVSYITLNIQMQEVTAFGGVIGVCGPPNCTAEDYKSDAVKKKIQDSEIELNKVTILIGVNISTLFANVTIIPVDPDAFPPVTASSWVGFFVVAIPVVLALVASGIKFAENQKSKATFDTLDLNLGASQRTDSYVALQERQAAQNKPSWYKILECWAIQDNLKQLFYPEVNPKHDTNLKIFNGVRFLSILWVLLGHLYLYRAYFISNYNDLPVLINDKFLNVVASGVFSVDTFFFLSGFFAAFVLHSKLKTMKAGVGTYGSVLLHRVIRILPMYVFVIMLYWKISVYLGSGPLWSYYVSGANGCDGSWWKSMLFIDSWFTDANCAGWGWYLSCDMQMFLISPLLVWVHLKKAKLGFLTIGLLLIASLSLGMYYNFADDVYAGPTSLGGNGTYFKDIYKNPLVRVPPYLVGTALALIYRSSKEGNVKVTFERIKKSKTTSWLIEISGVALISLLVWLPAQVQNKPQNWSPWFHHVFMTLNRFLFSIGLALIVLPTLTGSKTVIREVLSAGFWTPLAALTFATYLIHLVILFNYLFSERSTHNFDNKTNLWQMVPLAVVSLFAALIIHVVIEAPVGKLEGAIRGNVSKTAKSVEPKENKDISQSNEVTDDTKLIVGINDTLISNDESRVSEIQPSKENAKSTHRL